MASPSFGRLNLTRSPFALYSLSWPHQCFADFRFCPHSRQLLLKSFSVNFVFERCLPAVQSSSRPSKTIIHIYHLAGFDVEELKSISSKLLSSRLKISLSICCCCLFFTSFSSSRAFSSPALWFKLVLPAFFGPLLRLRWILISARFGSIWQGLSCISITSLVSYLSLKRIWVGNLHLSGPSIPLAPSNFSTGSSHVHTSVPVPRPNHPPTLMTMEGTHVIW